MDAAIRLSSGLAMPLFGLGTWQGAGDEIKKTVIRALELGYRHVDTAYIYGNEAHIGEALKEAFDKKVVTREEIFITSKLPHNGHRPDKVKHFLELSRNRLGLDYIDLYLIHWPIATQYVDDNTMTPTDQEKKTLLDEDVELIDTWRAMEECVNEGLVKSIGLSNFNSEQVKNIYDNAKVKPSNLQVECHLYHQQQQLVNFCSKLDIVVTAYAPLGSPGLPEYAKRVFQLDVPQSKVLLQDPVLREISQKYQKTSAQVALRALLQRGIVVIPKSTSEQRLRENSQIFDFALSDDDMDRLKSLDCGLRFFSYDFNPEFVASPRYPYSIPF